LPTDRYSPRQDQGERIFHFWLQAGPLQSRLEAVDREALAHNEAPMALSFFPSGAGAEIGPLAVLTDPVVQLTALKPAETSQDLILRLFEPTGTPRATRIRLPWAGLDIPIELGAFEIATLKVDWQAKRWQRVNLIEEPV
jgi:alpha-mannosidase